MTIILSSISSSTTLDSYAELIASVQAWSHRTDLADLMPDLVTLAEARISRDIRVRQMVTTATLIFPRGDGSAALPNDWLEFTNLTIEETPPRSLSYETIEQIGLRFSTGTPTVYSITGNRVQLGPVPNSDTTVSAMYYAKLPSLLGTPTNWLISQHPSIYLFAVLIEVMQYSQNAEQLALYTQRYQTESQQLINQDDRAKHSGSALRVKVI